MTTGTIYGRKDGGRQKRIIDSLLSGHRKVSMHKMMHTVGDCKMGRRMIGQANVTLIVRATQIAVNQEVGKRHWIGPTGRPSNIYLTCY